MIGKWYDLVVDTNGRTPEQVRLIDQTITAMFPAAFFAPHGLPIQNEDGTYKMRCWVAESLPGLKRFLQMNQCKIIKEVEHDE
jgi:hypothetical protein